MRQVPSSTVSPSENFAIAEQTNDIASTPQLLTSIAVKFDTEQLPAILNAVTTQNGDQKLILEVAVRTPRIEEVGTASLIQDSNIWVRTSSDVLPWMVPRVSSAVPRPPTPVPPSRFPLVTVPLVVS